MHSTARTHPAPPFGRLRINSARDDRHSTSERQSTPLERGFVRRSRILLFYYSCDSQYYLKNKQCCNSPLSRGVNSSVGRRRGVLKIVRWPGCGIHMPQACHSSRNGGAKIGECLDPSARSGQAKLGMTVKRARL